MALPFFRVHVLPYLMAAILAGSSIRTAMGARVSANNLADLGREDMGKSDGASDDLTNHSAPYGRKGESWVPTAEDRAAARDPRLLKRLGMLPPTPFPPTPAPPANCRMKLRAKLVSFDGDGKDDPIRHDYWWDGYYGKQKVFESDRQYKDPLRDENPTSVYWPNGDGFVFWDSIFPCRQAPRVDVTPLKFQVKEGGMWESDKVLFDKWKLPPKAKFTFQQDKDDPTRCEGLVGSNVRQDDRHRKIVTLEQIGKYGKLHDYTGMAVVKVLLCQWGV